MKLSNLAIPSDAQRGAPKKKVKTLFEQQRAACKTYEDLVKLGYARNMNCPEAWAEHVLAQRERNS
jgi:hypothetical protein